MPDANPGEWLAKNRPELYADAQRRWKPIEEQANQLTRAKANLSSGELAQLGDSQRRDFARSSPRPASPAPAVTARAPVRPNPALPARPLPGATAAPAPLPGLPKSGGDLTAIYQQALETEPGQKQAGEIELGHELGMALDVLYDAIEKRANLGGKALSALGVYAGGSGLAAAILAYQSAKKRQHSELLAKAQEKRRKLRYEAQPSPFYVHPVLPAELDNEPELQQLAAGF
jgi:hypothetical protein